VTKKEKITNVSPRKKLGYYTIILNTLGDTSVANKKERVMQRHGVEHLSSTNLTSGVAYSDGINENSREKSHNSDIKLSFFFF
jgi:hypothetical protein